MQKAEVIFPYTPPNNRMQRTAKFANADAGRSAEIKEIGIDST